MIVDLFEIDRTSEVKNFQEKIRSYFEDRYVKKIEAKKLQNEINTWLSLDKYQNIRSQNQNVLGIYQKTNELYEKYKHNLDSSCNDFVRNFPKQCWQNIFELAMADFVSNKFLLKEKNISPDLEFKNYFLECTSAASSLLNKYDAWLPLFDDFFEVILFFYKKHQQLKTDFPSIFEEWYFDSSILAVWQKLNKEEQKSLTNKLLNIEPLDFITMEGAQNASFLHLIKSWIFLNRYGCMHFKEILPNSILCKLQSVNFPMNSIMNELSDYIKLKDLMAQRFGDLICGKLKNSYFQNCRPGIIAVSFSMLNQGLNIISIRDFFEHLQKNLSHILDQAIQREIENPIKKKGKNLGEKTKEEKEKTKNSILFGLKNLYAVIIDTNWYNWFPDIAEKIHGAQFQKNYKNCYGIIYNTRLSKDIACDQRIFDSLIPSRINLPFCVEDNDIICQ